MQEYHMLRELDDVDFCIFNKFRSCEFRAII